MMLMLFTMSADEPEHVGFSVNYVCVCIKGVWLVYYFIVYCFSE
jgi:hypothetical protein